MRILRVIPISRGISKENLTYFTSQDTPKGAIVSVPIRGRRVNAIVVSSEEAEDKKTELRSSDFSLKKVHSVKSEHLLSQDFLESANQAAEYFATTTGAILNAFLPQAILENPEKIKIEKPNDAQTNSPTKHPPEQFILQSDDDERLAHYKSLIREEFARKRSIFFCLPTLEDIRRISESLEKGIQQYTYILHGFLTKKEIIDAWIKIAEEKHPVVIIATGSFFAVPRNDIGSIIIEKESSKGYKMVSRPYADIRAFAEIFAKKIGAKLIFGDALLRAETIWRHKQGDFVELAPLKFRSISTAEQDIIDMTKYKNESENKEGKFRILSDELIELIKQSKDNSENLFIFAVRRGLAPSIICGDCGSVVTCSHCSAPIVLHKNNKQNIFLCHKCGEKRTSEEHCKTCDSWRLDILGVGIERVEEEIKKLFPDIKLFKMDKDSVKSYKRASEIVKKFESSPGSVLIGTEMALLYLNKKIENTAIASIDSLFSVPDFRIQEKVMHILLKMRFLAQKRLLLQTRNLEQKTIEYAMRGNLIDFYRDEVTEREKFGYPPFSMLVKITLQGQKSDVIKVMNETQKNFEGYEMITFPAFTPIVKGKYVMNGLIKLAPEKWTDKELLAKLYALPPQFAIRIDPESIL